MSTIYLMFDVDQDVKLLKEAPGNDDVCGFYDGRFLKIEEGRVYASYAYEEHFEWVEVC